MTDPSFAGQLIAFTYPHIGNYGVSAQAMESERAWARAAIMREACNREDAPRRGARLARLARPTAACRRSAAWTRARWCSHIREAGAMRGGVFPSGDLRGARRAIWSRPSRRWPGRISPRVVTPREVIVTATGDGPRIAVIDTGIKGSMVRELVERGARVALYPCTTLRRQSCSRTIPTRSSSPTAPATRRRSDYIVDTVRELVGRKPVWGICLGHQLLCRAVGLETFKLPFGHRGANHPGQGSADRSRRDHLPEPRLRGARARAARARSTPTSRCAGRRTSARRRSRT